MATKKKSRKMDRKLVASLDPKEISWIAKHYKVPVADVRAATKTVGRSRAKVYQYLRDAGYEIKTRRYK